MKSIKIFGAFTFALILGIFTGIGFNSTFQASASVPIGNEYHSNIATSTMASASAGTLIKTGTGTLGSLIITKPATAGDSLKVYDATSTATTTYQTYDNTQTTKTYGRLVSEIASATIAGTYTFDLTLYKGLVIEIPSSWNGIYTITWR
jgi:hypothetical protein